MKKIIVIGAGAAGVFAAIRCAEANPKTKVTILESGNKVLRKVKISGGGRCNVTHHQFMSAEFVKNYPRGSRELQSPFTQFQAEDTVKWFADRGVKMKAEEDGRMFPVTDSSQTIINCFLNEVKKLNIQIITGKKVTSVKKEGNQFSIWTEQKDQFKAEGLMLATGSMPEGYKLAKQLGHSITPLAPSLFTFKINSRLLKDLAGISFPEVELTLKTSKKTFQQVGPLLITHWGLSGPAVLKLSAWAAREMKEDNYQSTLEINWLNKKRAPLLEELFKNKNSKSKLTNLYPQELAGRFWEQFLKVNQLDADTPWNQLPHKQYNQLADALYKTSLEVEGKSRFKEEFVECGGVHLKEIDFKTMESKLTPGLFFAGELLDIDGITGGFNFQNAWTGGWIAGTSLAHLP